MTKAPAARMAATHAGKMPATRAAGQRFHQSRQSLKCRYIHHSSFVIGHSSFGLRCTAELRSKVSSISFRAPASACVTQAPRHSTFSIRMTKAPAARMAATHAGKMPATRGAGQRFHQSRQSLKCRYIRHWSFVIDSSFGLRHSTFGSIRPSSLTMTIGLSRLAGPLF